MRKYILFIALVIALTGCTSKSQEKRISQEKTTADKGKIEDPIFEYVKSDEIVDGIILITVRHKKSGCLSTLTNYGIRVSEPVPLLIYNGNTVECMK
jgi:hypothetical protein